MEDFMDSIKKIWDNPIGKKVVMGTGIFILGIIIIMLIAKCSVKKQYTFEELQKYLIEITQKYYENNKESLPKKDKDKVTLSIATLINNGLIKDTAEITKDGLSCRGDIKIINNNGYYLYVPDIDCGKDNKSVSLNSVITNEKNIVTTGNGLYKNGNKYLYKGDNINNYLSFNNIIYRIVNINEDGSIRAIDTSKRDSSPWDDRYNIDKDSNVGINNYVANGINSRIKDSIEKIYADDTLIPITNKPYFVTFSECIGKRSIKDTTKNGETECQSKIEKQVFTLLRAYDYFLASLDPNCTAGGEDNYSCNNYNYLLDIGNTWTITADADTTYKVFKITADGVSLSNASNDSSYKIVVNFDPNIIYKSGKGTIEDPYIIDTFTK
jgi:hypothetical protein